MPYATNRSLPLSVKILPGEAQTIWREVFNRNYRYYGEDVARRIAWTAVHNAGYEKTEEGRWIKK